MTTTITIDGHGVGRTYDGVGAISANGTSRFLIDYPEPYRSQVLDYLFKPGYGANLQQLKVEIGGDTNTTDGAEPSHMRSPTDQNYTRGYEWWLMEQAKARNPNIVFSALEWGAPGWIGGGNFYSQDNINYIINFIKGAKAYHNLDIQYVGIWNETHYDVAWIKQLKGALQAAGLSTRIIAADQVNTWNIADDMTADPALNAAVDVVGVHYPGYPIWTGIGNFTPTYTSSPAAQQLGKPLWASEDGPWRGDWTGAMELAKMYNRNYIDGKMTATIIWPAVTSYYDNLPLPEAGLMSADTPWSGAYAVQPAIWATAQTTQFAQPGWQYIDSASGYLAGQGSYVTLKAPNGSDYSMIVETADATSPQTLTFTVTNGLSLGTVHVWETTQANAFMHVADLSPVSGTVALTLDPHAIYSLTTTAGQGKGNATGAAPAAFPFPYTESFEGYNVGDHPRYMADQEGSFEVAPCTGRAGMCLEQVVSQPSIPWVGGAGEPASDNHNNPSAIVGDVNWRDYTVSADVLLQTSGPAYLYGHNGGCWLRIDSDGTWTLHTGVRELTGALPGALNTWHTLMLSFVGVHIQAYIDGTLVASVDDSTSASGLVGLGTGWVNGQWTIAQFDNLAVQAVTQTAPAPTSTAAPSTTPTASPTPLPTLTATSSAMPSPTATSTPLPTATASPPPSPAATTPPSPPRPISVPSATPVPPTTIPTTAPHAQDTAAIPIAPTASPPVVRLTEAPRPTRRSLRTRPKHVPKRLTHRKTPRVPLNIIMQRRVFVAGAWLSLRVHTAPQARVNIALRVLVAKTTCSRRRHRRRCIVRRVVVYSLALRGTANAHGAFAKRARIRYRPNKPVPADLAVVARTAAATRTRHVRVIIEPAPRRRATHLRAHHGRWWMAPR